MDMEATTEAAIAAVEGTILVDTTAEAIHLVDIMEAHGVNLMAHTQVEHLSLYLRGDYGTR